MNDIRQLAIIGSTASGKTALAVKTAQQMNAHILSLDSLSIYKEIDIVSAKPTVEEREGIQHFGIDYIYPNEAFDVTTFIQLYHYVFDRCQEEGKDLVIVGGTGFYLKMLIEGVSDNPVISEETKAESRKLLLDLPKVYQMLTSLDPEYMSHIESNDRYRIGKALELYLQSKQSPSAYFKNHPPVPTITAPLSIYQIEWEREILRQRIAFRTELMVKNGLIDEVCMLEKKYGRSPNCMKAIGIKETLAYLDGIYSKEEMISKISTNTARLAKRQKTFNNSQFDNVLKGSIGDLEKVLFR
jgi:tRNA dimethylallyltransferase